MREANPPMSSKPVPTMHCHFCARAVSEFFRQQWQRPPIRRPIDRLVVQPFFQAREHRQGFGRGERLLPATFLPETSTQPRYLGCHKHWYP